jgi:hypothetical protein
VTITVDFEVATTTGSGTAVDLTSGSFTPPANSKCYVWAMAGNNGFTITKVWGISNTGGLSFSLAENPPDRNSFGGLADYAAQAQLWVADVGGSPSSMTVTVDADTGSALAFRYSIAVFCVSSDATLAFVQSKSASEAENSGNSESIAVTMDSPITNGNTAVVCIAAYADEAGGSTIPTGFDNVLVNQTGATSAQLAVAYDDDITDTTITCTDLGQVVGSSAIAVLEFNDGAEPPASVVLRSPIRSALRLA